MSSSGPKYFQQTLMQKSGPHEFVEKFVAERNDELHATEVRTLAPAAVAARQIIWCPEPTLMSERACVDDRFRILLHKSSEPVSSCVRSVLADRFGVFCVRQEAVEQRRAAAAMEEQQRAEAAEAKVVAKREAAVSYM